MLFLFVAASAFAQFVVKNSANSTLMVVTQNGDVGVGISAPQVKLDVRGELYSSKSSGTGGVMLTSGHVSGVWAGGIINAQDASGTVRPLSLQMHAGNVGIGTTAPTQKLTVAGSINASSLAGTASRLVTSNAGGTLTNLATGTNKQFLRGDLTWQAIAGDNLGNHIATENVRLGNYWLSGDGGNEGIRVTAAGNVGIGTSAPDARLTVGAPIGGTAASSIFTTNAGALGTAEGNSLKLASIGFTSSNQSSLGIEAFRTGAGSSWETTAIALKMDVDNVSPVNGGAIYLTSAGTVGIYTYKPQAKFHVNGEYLITDPVNFPGKTFHRGAVVSVPELPVAGDHESQALTASISFNPSSSFTGYRAAIASFGGVAITPTAPGRFAGGGSLGVTTRGTYGSEQYTRIAGLHGTILANETTDALQSGPTSFGAAVFADVLENSPVKPRLFSVYAAGAKAFFSSPVGIGWGAENPAYMLHVVGDAGKTSGGSAWTVISDKRVKNIHGTFNRGLDAINELNPVYFTYREDAPMPVTPGVETVGIVAQDLLQVIPEAVKEFSNGYLGMNTDPIFWTMINAIKELTSRVEHLENENHRLQGK